MGKHKTTPEQRFWSHVSIVSGECWRWRGGKRGQYGVFFYQGKREGAHRVSFIINFGPIPRDRDVLHRCDNPLCVNPDHLFLGTHAENMHDMKAKGRAKAPCGDKANAGKLNTEQVRQIREYLKMGLSQRTIADFYGVSSAAISNIHTGTTWNHLP